MIEEKKDWQHGHSLESLKAIEVEYKQYNSYALSPFAQYKKNNIATDLHEGTLNVCYINGILQYARVAKKVKVASDINLYGNVIIGRKLPGDRVITKLIGTRTGIQIVLSSLQYESNWIYIWAEDIDLKSILRRNGYTYVGGKITTYGEIYSIWFREGVTNKLIQEDRCHPTIDPVDLIGLKKIKNVSETLMNMAAYQLEQLNLDFTNHYSNYNKDKSWSAISLRGYSSDIQFIENPDVMNKKWKEKHKDENYFLQDTILYKTFYWIKNYLEEIFQSQIRRVRFMKLQPGGGELERHTDQVDTEIGSNIGDVARFHMPIVTNDQMIFTSWDTKGSKIQCNMKVGELWYLNIRCPHQAINNGNEPRIHLVVDVEVNDFVKKLLGT